MNSTQPETHKLQQVSYHQADIRRRSHRLLRLDDNKSVIHVVNGLAASCELHAADAQALCKLFHQLAASLMFTDLMQLDEVNRLDTTCWQIASGHKIHNLHQVCGVFGCVSRSGNACSGHNRSSLFQWVSLSLFRDTISLIFSNYFLHKGYTCLGPLVKSFLTCWFYWLSA